MTRTFDSPKVFISYAWESDELKEWVLKFSTDLRNNGIDVTLDQWDVVPGDKMPHFMELAVKQNNFVLIVCSEKYKQKSEGRIGGVGYEGDIMTAEVLQNADHRKFIPVIRLGNTKNAIPSWLGGKFHLDFSDDAKYEHNFDELMQTLLGIRKVAPPLGQIPEKYRVEMEKAAIKRDEAEQENVKLETEVQVSPAIKSQIAKSVAIPKIEADLIWHGGSRAPRGYSDKNPIVQDDNGQYVRLIGSKPIIHWELDWRFDLVLHNNSTVPAFNISIKSVGKAHFRNLDNLPDVNNIGPMKNIALKAGFGQRIESDHTVADEIMKFKIPQQLEGLFLEISYKNEQQEKFETIVKVENNKLINLFS